MRERAKSSRQAGFTLMELVVTLALLGLVAMLAAPLAELTVQRSREAALRDGLREIRGAIDRYKTAADRGLIKREVGDSGYPPSLQVLVEGVANQKSPSDEKFYFLRRLPRDPFAGDAAQPAAESWVLRSYASAPDSPSAGADVFDVTTSARGTGLNGVPYREW
jgi:general secretion pathway protein G